MTFQVALVGSDGLIVGSDRKMFLRPPGPANEERFVQFDSQSKFISSEDNSVICACSGSQESQRVAREIIQSFTLGVSDIHWHSVLDSIAQRPNMDTREQPSKLIVVRTDRTNYATWVVAAPRGFISRIEGKQCAGVNSSACFLTQNFYSQKPVEQLRKLALLVLDYAATEYPTTVGDGYDLRIITANGVEEEYYSEGGHEILEIRKSFQASVNIAIFPQ